MNGILLIDKQPDWTSNDVVAKLKGILHQRRIGHSGTLDPMATGLLVVFVGRATRAVEFAESHEKEYLAGLRLGVETDTQDITGTVLQTCDRAVSRTELEAALSGFRGEIDQIPPMYSAIKVQGRKLCDIARKGGEVERKPRHITISRLELLPGEGPDWQLDVVCSKGTYIRTLCHDIGQALGTGGAMSALRRVRAGLFTLDGAHTLEEVQAAADAGQAEHLLLPVDSLFADVPAVTLDARAEKRCRVGGEFAWDAPDGEARLYAPGGEFLALARMEQGVCRTVKSFFEV